MAALIIEEIDAVYWMTPLRTYPVGDVPTPHAAQSTRRRPGTYEPRTQLLLPRHALEQRARAEDVAQERRPVVEHDAVARGLAHDERLQVDAAHVAPVEERAGRRVGGELARRGRAVGAAQLHQDAEPDGSQSTGRDNS